MTTALWSNQQLPPTHTWQKVTESDLPRIAQELVAELKTGMLVALTGEMGAGKTTCVRQFLRCLGWTDPVVSPTFPLLVDYELPSSSSISHLIHIDAFRLSADQEEPWSRSDWAQSLVFVEWPERCRIPFAAYAWHLHFDVPELEETARSIRAWKK